MPRNGSFCRIAACLIAMLLAVPAAAMCPFCPPSSPPLAEQLAAADAAVLVKWVRSKDMTGPSGEEALTDFSVVEPLRQKDSRPATGETIQVPYLLKGRPGDLFLMFGQRTGEVTEWQLPLEVTEISYAYIKQAPSPERPVRERLPYFLKFLQFSDPTIANDAFAEFSRAPYNDVAALRDRLSRDKVRQWMTELSVTEQMRKGFYGMLLGLCGTADDAAYLAEQVLKPTPPDEVRLGLDGMMGGYVMLTGQAGLQKLVSARLDQPGQPDGDIYAFVNALRFLWEFAEIQVPRAEVAAAMARLIDRPAFAEVALGDLARWNHWQVTDRVLALYGKPPFDDPFAKRQLIHFAMACVKAGEKHADQPLPQAKLAEKFLADLETSDPESLRNARRFFTRP